MCLRGLSIFCSLGGVFLSFYGMKNCAITTDVWIMFFCAAPFVSTILSVRLLLVINFISLDFVIHVWTTIGCESTEEF